jgi:biotin synthase
VRRRFEKLVMKAAEHHELTKEELLCILQPEDDEEKILLFKKADEVRQRYCGDDVHLRGIIEFSNICEKNCLYCGLRKDNHKLNRYRIPEEEILNAAKKAYFLGYRTIVLQSGEDSWYTVDRLCGIVRKIKQHLDVAVTLCIGERTYEEYRELRKVGADRYLLKHETANPLLYSRLHPGMLFYDRINRLKWLKELGYQVGAGNIVGLPGQSIEDLADDILFLKQMDVDMAGIGPFIPHGNTPLGKTSGGTLDLTLRVLACTRLLLPRVHLPATTAVGTLHPYGREKALQCGANVVMPNITPAKYRKDYEIYPNKICIDEEPEHCRGCIQRRIESIGRTVATDYGHSLKLNKRGA